MAFEKSVLSIVAYGLCVTFVTSIAFNNHARHADGLFAMKCITMSSDMKIEHFKHRFMYTNNISLIQILFKVNMRFFFLSVYIYRQFNSVKNMGFFLSDSTNRLPYTVQTLPFIIVTSAGMFAL